MCQKCTFVEFGDIHCIFLLAMRNAAWTKPIVSKFVEISEALPVAGSLCHFCISILQIFDLLVLHNLVLERKQQYCNNALHCMQK